MIPLLADIERILLREWDPIGVRDVPGAEDEYDGYAFRIFTMLKSHAPEADVGENMGLPPRPITTEPSPPRSSPCKLNFAAFRSRLRAVPWRSWRSTSQGRSRNDVRAFCRGADAAARR